jgi:hypothetical protein
MNEESELDELLARVHELETALGRLIDAISGRHWPQSSQKAMMTKDGPRVVNVVLRDARAALGHRDE